MHPVRTRSYASLVELVGELVMSIDSPLLGGLDEWERLSAARHGDPPFVGLSSGERRLLRICVAIDEILDEIEGIDAGRQVQVRDLLARIGERA
jgi:hypothetical protein